ANFNAIRCYAKVAAIDDDRLDDVGQRTLEHDRAGNGLTGRIGDLKYDRLDPWDVVRVNDCLTQATVTAVVCVGDKEEVSKRDLSQEGRQVEGWGVSGCHGDWARLESSLGGGHRRRHGPKESRPAHEKLN